MTRRATLRALGFSLLLTAMGLLSQACFVATVQPWERDLLSEPEMMPVPDALERSLDEHIYFSKETAHGGAGVGGGGCGCN